MERQGFARARLTWAAYDDGRKRENSSARKHRIIVASTCKRFVTRYLGRKEILNTKNNDFNCAAIVALWHGAFSDWLNPFSLGTMSASA